MPEKDKEEESDRVKPLEVKPGGKEKGTRIVLMGAEDRQSKK
jgi:hypothetical protein